MAGPTTEYLADQIDNLRSEVAAIGKESHAVRLDAIDGLKRLGDTMTVQFEKVHEHFADELSGFRKEAVAATEGLKMDQGLIREDVVRLQSQTSELIARFDRTLGFLKALLFTLIGVGVTVLGAAAGAIWNGFRVYHAVEGQGQRLDRLEESDIGTAKLYESMENIRRTLDDRLPPAGK